MFTTAKINHIKLLLPKTRVHVLLDVLFEKGICQINKSSFENKVEYADGEVNEIRMKLSNSISLLEPYKKIIPTKALKELFSPNPPEKVNVNLLPQDKLLGIIRKEVDEVYPQVESKLRLIEDKQSEIEKNNETISTLEILPKISTDTYKNTQMLGVLVGFITVKSAQTIHDSLKNCVYTIYDVDEKKSLITVAYLLEDHHHINKVMHDFGFEHLHFPHQKKVTTDIIKDLEKANKDILSDIEKIESELETLAQNHMKRLEVFYEEIENVRTKIDGLHQVGTSVVFSEMDFFVPVDQMEDFLSVVDQICPSHYIEQDEKKESPTKYNNPKMIRPFELVTNLYSPPKYRRFDPTFILAITFSIFFGFMLTDAVYGIVMTILAFALMKGIGKYDEGVKNFSIVLIWCGISTTLLGAMFGSWFGNFFQELGFGVPQLLDSMRDIIPMMVIALSLGVIHIVLGLIFGIIENFKLKQVKQGLKDQGVWILFVLSIFSLILSMSGIVPRLLMVGAALLALSVIMQISLNWSDGAFVAILSIFNFTGFLGDVFSYARLMALAIGTAGIALAVNFMVFMLGDIPYIGIVLAIILFILGHVFNILMNGLGAFIHSLRLHFLEHFSKYYDGEGELYKPFMANRKKTHLEVGL